MSNDKEVAPARPEPRPDHVERAAEASARTLERRRARRTAPYTRVEKSDQGGLQLKATHTDDAGRHARVMDLLGTPSDLFAVTLQQQLLNASPHAAGSPEEMERAIDEGLAFIAGVQPENEVEACLAAQMWTTHQATMRLASATANCSTREGLRDYVNLSTKMQRTFVAQLETLNRLRTGGKQRVEVVYVDARGGQNVIGSVVHGGGGRGVEQSGGQSHAPVAGLAFAPGLPVWSEDAGGDAVSRSGDQGQAPLPDARRPGGSAERDS